MPGEGQKKEFDLLLVEELGIRHAPYIVMATRLKCSRGTVQNRMDEKGEFWTAYKRGMDNTNESLRSKQIDVALGGNVGMLIWLGKQRLGQMEPRDRRFDEAIADIAALKQQLADTQAAMAGAKEINV